MDAKVSYGTLRATARALAARLLAPRCPARRARREPTCRATLSFLMALVELRNADPPFDVPAALFGNGAVRRVHQA